MANIKISELNELTTKADNDYIPIVDSSADETKKISIDNLMDGVGGDATPIGAVQPFAGSTAPDGYLLCDGSAVSRTTYDALFEIIGTTYGTGDGSTTFNLPNLKGRTVVMRDTTQTEFDTLGETGGEKTHTLTTNEMPSHAHQLYANKGVEQVFNDSPIDATHGFTDEGAAVRINWQHHDTGDFRDTVTTGGGQAHNILQPYIVLNYVIKAFNTSSTPTESQVKNVYSNNTNDVYSCNYINNNDTYSTSEVKTNKRWEDGKPIYRKVVSGTYNTGSGGRITIDLTDTNIDSFTFCAGLWAPNSTVPTQYLGTPMINTNGGIDAYSQCRITNTNIIQFLVSVTQTEYYNLTGSYKITIEYTKTTDV